MKVKFAGLMVLAMCAAGCTTYYKVHDPTTGKDYYTTQLDKQSNGAATLKDARTGNTVSVQNSEISEIKKEEFETGKSTAPMSSSDKMMTSPSK